MSSLRGREIEGGLEMEGGRYLLINIKLCTQQCDRIVKEADTNQRMLTS